MKEIFGNIHSIESCGTVDGPGIRLVVFMQGCPMRCLYCHNPDTWSFEQNKKMSVEEILKKYNDLKEFLKNGGITVSGGEPLLQTDFVTELFSRAKEQNIHTALDTSGILFDINNTEEIDKLLSVTSLVLLDIKHINDEEHKKLTGVSNKNILDFAKYLSDKKIPMWIRHVVVPEYTYKEEYLVQTGEFLAVLNNIQALDILPYHDMAVSKYESMKLDYPLKDIKPLSKQEALEARKIIINSYKEAKSKTQNKNSPK